MKYFKIYIYFTLIILLFLINNNNNIESFYFESDASTTTSTSTENDNDNLKTDCENITDIKDSLKEVWNDIPNKYTQSKKEGDIINEWKAYLSNRPKEEDYCDMGTSPNCCE